MKENTMLSQRTGEPPGPYQSVWDRFVDKCSEYADRPAIIAATGARPATMAEVISYAELRVFAERIASHLEQSHGIGRGSRVATLLPSGAGGALVFWAAMKLQATFIPLNTALRTAEHELCAILGGLKPELLVVSDLDDDFNDLSSQVKLLAVSDLLGPSSMNGEGGLPTPPEDNMNNIPSTDAAAPTICFLTSGTSSTPKACIHSQLNLSAAALAQAQSRCLQPNDRLCQQMPQFHAYGFSMSLAFWLTGAAVVFPGMSFDASASVQAVEKYGCTITAAVPTMIHAMANHVAMTNSKLEKLRSVDIAGSVVHEGVLRICVETLGVKKAAPSYGMTECPAVLATRDKEMDRTVPAIDEIAASGYPTAGVTAKICAVGTRDVVPIGTNGVLHLSGPTVVSGYLGGREPETFYDGMSFCREIGCNANVKEMDPGIGSLPATKRRWIPREECSFWGGTKI
jgi:acyl-CoA synthetase (AMP-forming)/AMP-acid ligase II